MRLKGVIFDIDGTLADSLRICCDAFKQTVESCTGRKVSDADVARQYGPSEEGILRSIVPEMPDVALERYLATYDALCAASLTPLPGLRELLDSLRRRSVRLAVVTGKGQYSTHITLRHLGITDCFDSIAFGSPVRNIKAESLVGVVNAWGLPASEVAYVGDMEADIQAALQAGVFPVLATWFSEPGSQQHIDCPEFAKFDRFADWIDSYV